MLKFIKHFLGCLGGSHNYWWMSDPSVFSSGKGPQQDNQVGQVNGNYGNQPQQNIDYQTQGKKLEFN